MIVISIIAGYLIISLVEILALKSNRYHWREIYFYIFFMFVSMMISIYVAANEDTPSIASIIRRLLSPIIMK